jgi:RNA polymerase sigma-70 factor (ECF subfamily)
VQDLGQAGDRELIERVAVGDRAAFELIVRRHGPSLRRLARALTSDAVADDVLQEALLDAFRHASGFRGDGSVRAWLFTLTRHRAFHQRTRAGSVEIPDTPLLELGLEAGFGERPERVAERLEQRDAISVGLARLSPEEREVLILRDVEGLSGEEAAVVLGVELAAMKSRLHRARLKLMGALRETGGSDGE